MWKPVPGYAGGAMTGSLFACWRKHVPLPLAEQPDGICNLDGKHSAQAGGAAFCDNMWGLYPFHCCKPFSDNKHKEITKGY